MRKTLILARRELASYFVSPMAYVIAAMFLLSSGLCFFHKIFVPGNEASLRPLFEAMAYIMVFAAPLLTMRLLSEEFRSGTIETLMTAPISDATVILGKFLGVMAFYVILLAGTGIFLGLMVAYGQPDGGVAAMGYLGMLLLGSAFVAVGLFASAITRYQLVAAIVAVAILAVLAILMQAIVRYGSEPWNYLAARLNAMTYFRDFARGVFDTRGVVFFGSVTALFLFLGVKALESQRWR
ncbi:MAG: ABC transporter permease subunit [Phycisphaerae bacterium]|nr:ABC transporter permease subunit [Phycisphaerae bacterium]